MAKTDIEINIGRRFFIALIAIVAIIALIIFLFQIYDSSQKRNLFHKMYLAMAESKELKEIGALINKIDTSEMDWMKDKAYLQGSAYHNNMQCLGFENTPISDSILTRMRHFMQQNSELFDNIYVQFEFGYYVITFSRDKNYSSCNLDNSLNYYWYGIDENNAGNIYEKYKRNEKVSEEEMFEKLVDGKAFRVIQTLDNARFKIYLDGNNYEY